MTKPIPGIKIPYFNAEQYPDEVPGFRCVEVLIPDDESFMALLGGLLKLPARQFNWKNSDFATRLKMAAMWRDAYIAGDWGECMDCNDVAECIEEHEGTRDAILRLVAGAFPQLKGIEIPQEYAEQNQYPASLGCDYPKGWGHIRHGLIERSFQRVIDVLEQIEAVTNNQEMLAQFINAIPGIGAVFDVVPVTDWVLWFDNVRAWMKEQFEAGDTVDLRDQIACDLFCIWQVNCSLSVDQIRQYYWDKTTTLIPEWEGAFDSMSALGAALSQLSQVDFGTNVVYALVGSQYGFITFINDWFGVTVSSVGNDLGLGDPSDDWETLCSICPEQYCDGMETELGDKTFIASETHNLALWNDCTADSTGEVGGIYVAESGEDGDGAIEGVLVCAADPTFGLEIRLGTAVVDLGAESDVIDASMRFANLDVAGSNSTVITLFDDTKTIIDQVSQNQTIVGGWRTFTYSTGAAGVRYIVFENVQSGTGGTPKVGRICVTYNGLET